MNRPGQPQQRPPNLTPNPTLASQFRPSYPTYGLTPRNVLQASGGYVPSLQPNNHRTNAQQSQVPSLTPQPTPGFNPPRGQSSYGFGAALNQHQSSALLQQQQQQQPPSSQQQQQQQHQTNGTASSMSSLLAQTGGLGGAPSVSSAGEVALDLSEFPALGTTPTNTNSSNNNATGPATSYASQAGTGVMLGGTGASALSGGSTAASQQTRDFTADDFPALGGQSQAGQASRDLSQNQSTVQDTLFHPPGLNGFQPSEQPPSSSHPRQQNMLGTLTGNPQQQQLTPGMLNLGGAQSRNVHPGFQHQQPSETDKLRERNQRDYSLKMSQPQAAWSSPNVNPSAQPQQNITGNGSLSQNQTSHGSGVVPNSSAHPPSTQTPFSSNGLSLPDGHPSANGNPTSLLASNTVANPTTLPTSSASTHLPYPQTPSQQVLISAADRWGLLSLITTIKNASADPDIALSSIGTDLGTMGLDMGYSGNLYSTFITPWADQSAARSVEPDFHLPACYLSVQAPPPGPAKALMFSDETLFFMFYSSPRDALQEIAAQELWNRNWRYHKENRVWITKESGTQPSHKVQNGIGEQGLYTYWDPENWTKERKEMTVLYSDLEEKSVPAFNPSSNVIAPNQGQSTPQHIGAQVQTQLPSRGSFQMGMAGL